MKIVTIVGARPQFIKAAPVSRAIEKHNRVSAGLQIKEIIVHTGQHYDANMSQVFFDELEIPEPDYHLGAGSGTHGKMTGAMLERIEDVLFQEKPDWVLVYGDTNSTLAGALAAAKLHIPVVHVEAGLRSFNRQMPEEINRVLTDHVSSFLFCPTDTAVENLRKEGITDHVLNVGDVMYDSFLFNKNIAYKKSAILKDLSLKPKCYCLVTVHRQENTGNEERLAGIFEAFNRLAKPDRPFIIPLHPRTEKILKQSGATSNNNPHVHIIKPVSYLDMVMLETHSKMILTDSGGVQKEAYFAQTPCVTLRNETEWVELVEGGYNKIAGNDPIAICKSYETMLDKTVSIDPELYGGGQASERVVKHLMSVAD